MDHKGTSLAAGTGKFLVASGNGKNSNSQDVLFIDEIRMCGYQTKIRGIDWSQRREEFIETFRISVVRLWADRLTSRHMTWLLSR